MNNKVDNEGKIEANQTYPSFIVRGYCIKDLSFENASGFLSFLPKENAEPQIDTEVAVKIEKVADSFFDVSVTQTINYKIGSETLYLIQIVFGGLCEVSGADQHDVSLIVYAECPRLMHPFMCAVMHSVIAASGFPPIMLPNIDFYKLYQEQVAKQGKLNGNSENKEETTNDA